MGSNPGFTNCSSASPDAPEPRSKRREPLPVREVWVARCRREDVRAETALRLPAPPGFYTHPAISPDGRRVAFWGGSGRAVDLWVADLSARRIDCLTGGDGVNCHPAWSPDSTRLVFCRKDNGPPGSYYPPWGAAQELYAPRDIWILDLSGGGRRRITRGPADHERPAWSPDGERIVYVHTSPGSVAKDVVVINADGSSPRRLTGGEGVFYRPAWSPDGSRLALNNKGDGEHYLWTMNDDGKRLRRLLPDNHPAGVHDHGSYWTADGKDILFHSDRGGRWGLWLAGADGSNLRRMPVEGFNSLGHAGWDSGETRLAFDAPPNAAARGPADAVTWPEQTDDRK